MQSEISDQQFEEIYQSLCKDERFWGQLKGYFEKIMKMELERKETYNQVAVFLDGLAKEPFLQFPSLLHMLSQIKSAIESVCEKIVHPIDKDNDKGLIALIQKKILPSLSDSQKAVETQKKSLSEYKELAQKEKKLEEKKNESLTKNNDKLLQIEKQLQEVSREKKEKKSTFQFTYKTYIEDRDDELRGLWKHFLNRQLAIAAAELQCYSTAINKVQMTDEREEVRARLIELGIMKKK